jgi:hypothetical protein
MSQLFAPYLSIKDWGTFQTELGEAVSLRQRKQA